MLVLSLLFLIFLALSVILVIAAKKIPQLASLTMKESAAHRFRRLKSAIALRRLKDYLQFGVRKYFNPVVQERLAYLIKQSYARIKLLEEQYRLKTTAAKIELLLTRGRRNLSEDPAFAEHCFLEVATLDPHHLEAYEGLFEVYCRQKNIADAQETLDFIKTLKSAALPQLYFRFAQLLKETDKLKEAEKYGAEALAGEPDNPKFLDFLIELAILQGRLKVAAVYLAHLEKVNPENSKIAEFKKRLATPAVSPL